MRELVRFLDDPRTALSRYDLATIGEPAELQIDSESLRLQEESEYRRGPRLRPVTMRLDPDLVVALKRIATHQRVSYQTLARMWLRERVIEELRGRVERSGARHGGTWPARVSEQSRVEQLLVDVKSELTQVRTLLGRTGRKRQEAGRRAASTRATPRLRRS
jgi:hypothetical protein